MCDGLGRNKIVRVGKKSGPHLRHSNEQSNRLILRRFYVVSRLLRFLDGLLLVPLHGLLVQSHVVSMYSPFSYCCSFNVCEN